MGDCLPWTPMIRRAKFVAASFILGGDIRTVETHKQKTRTNYSRYIHTLPIGMCG